MRYARECGEIHCSSHALHKYLPVECDVAMAGSCCHKHSTNGTARSLTPCAVSLQVYKAMRRSVLPVAVKVVSGAVAKTEDAQVEFLREVAYLRSLLSPNIVQFQVTPLQANLYVDLLRTKARVPSRT